MSKKAVVTGAAGFIGSHMVDLLINENFEVRGLDNLTGGREANLAHHRNNPKLKFEVKDCRELKPGDALFKDADYVIHFAGKGDIVPSIEEPLDYMSCNVMATVHVLEAAREAKVKKLVYAASSSCYGVTTELPTTVHAPIQPQYPYALSKFQGEQAVLHWGNVYKLPVVSIRIFNAYGPRSRTSGAYGAVFGVFLKQKLAGKPFTVVGDGTQSRDFLFVTDVARAFYLGAVSDRTQEIYNLGGGKPQSVNRLVELLGGEKLHIPKRPGEPECTFADISKIQRELDWSPKVSFEDGVALLLKSIDYWQEAPLWTPETIEKATATWFKVLSEEKLK
jgi:UDP-glucose 4-epimerase